jgi:hypothetical protein
MNSSSLRLLVRTGQRAFRGICQCCQKHVHLYFPPENVFKNYSWTHTQKYKNIILQGTHENVVYTHELWKRSMNEQIYCIANKTRFLLKMQLLATWNLSWHGVNSRITVKWKGKTNNSKKMYGRTLDVDMRISGNKNARIMWLLLHK